MRLLNVHTRQVEDFASRRLPPYAILSHTWSAHETTLQDVQSWTARLGLRSWPAKLPGCCRRAAADKLDYIWVDSCCINKSDAVELSEAINSMFAWYRDAVVCYVYLADVDWPADSTDSSASPGGFASRSGFASGFSSTSVDKSSSGSQYRGSSRVKDGSGSVATTIDALARRRAEETFRQSRWFTRGWTLQELLAPHLVQFYDRTWRFIGTKPALSGSIEAATGIPRSYLLRATPLTQASVAQRFSWAAERQTSKAEDRAYCLLGIFGVNMPMIYGEGGENAFLRLQQEILKESRDQSILAWGYVPDRAGERGVDGGGTEPGMDDEKAPSFFPSMSNKGAFLASHPRDFYHCRNVVFKEDSHQEALSKQLRQQGDSPFVSHLTQNQPQSHLETLEYVSGTLRLSAVLFRDNEDGLFARLNCGVGFHRDSRIMLPLREANSPLAADALGGGMGSAGPHSYYVRDPRRRPKLHHRGGTFPAQLQRQASSASSASSSSTSSLQAQPQLIRLVRAVDVSPTERPIDRRDWIYLDALEPQMVGRLALVEVWPPSWWMKSWDMIATTEQDHGKTESPSRRETEGFVDVSLPRNRGRDEEGGDTFVVLRYRRPWTPVASGRATDFAVVVALSRRGTSNSGNSTPTSPHPDDETGPLASKVCLFLISTTQSLESLVDAIPLLPSSLCESTAASTPDGDISIGVTLRAEAVTGQRMLVLRLRDCSLSSSSFGGASAVGRPAEKSDARTEKARRSSDNRHGAIATPDDEADGVEHQQHIHTVELTRQALLRAEGLDERQRQAVERRLFAAENPRFLNAETRRYTIEGFGSDGVQMQYGRGEGQRDGRGGHALLVIRNFIVEDGPRLIVFVSSVLVAMMVAGIVYYTR